MSDSQLLSISEVASATGLRSSALRFYERTGLITPAERHGGRRHYDRAVLRRLAVVALLQEVGFTISEIAQLVADQRGGARWRPLAQRKLEEIDAHLDHVNAARALLTAALECRCSGLETCDHVKEREGRHAEVTQTITLTRRPRGAHREL